VKDKLFGELKKAYREELHRWEESGFTYPFHSSYISFERLQDSLNVSIERIRALVLVLIEEGKATQGFTGNVVRYYPPRSEIERIWEIRNQRISRANEDRQRILKILGRHNFPPPGSGKAEISLPIEAALELLRRSGLR
jgi:hypothetical protein